MTKKYRKMPFFPVVGVGGSAGGLEAFRELLKNLPPNLEMAYIFIMHLAPGSKSVLPEILAKVARMPVHEAKNGMRLEPDHVYVISPSVSISIAGGKLVLTKVRASDIRRMPIDNLFRSLSEVQGNKSLGVILSGTATDGTLGAEAIKAAGGITFAQDESARYDGMPHSAITAGCIDYVLSPKRIAEELGHISKHPLMFSTEKHAAGKPVIDYEKGFDSILAILREAKGLDFTHYKTPTTRRRISRRMVLLKTRDFKSYIKILRADSDEVDRLYEDLLLKVTSFFRDPKTFGELRKRILPKIINSKTKNQVIRVWVPGCSSGEEAYSIAICIAEALGSRAGEVSVRIFATDASDAIIDKARKGIYGLHIEEAVAPQTLKKFFTRMGNSYRVSKSLREMCIFSKQNVFSDPPFSNMDLVSCRNLLIYFQPVLQKKALEHIHYALNNNGFLMLGASESIGSSPDLFKAVNRKLRIFSKKYLPAKLRIEGGRRHYVPIIKGIKKQDVVTKGAEIDVEKLVDGAVLGEYAPCGALIDSDMQVILFRGHTGRYLESASGKPSFNIIKLAREGLALPLRVAIHQAKKTNRTVKKEVREERSAGRKERVAITVIPIKPKSVREKFFLVLFDRVRAAETASGKRLNKKMTFKGKSAREDSLVKVLRKELAETKEYLQTVTEEHESAIEEASTASEELLSSNEELQSTNEELETAKEELQSSNEELITANEELQNRNEVASVLNNDLVNLLASINVPIVMMDKDLIVRRITPQTEKALNVASSDIGRLISKIKLSVEIPHLEKVLIDVMESRHSRSLEIEDRDGRWYSIYMRPYRTTDNKIDGVVAIFVDINDSKRAKAVIDKLLAEQMTIFNAVPAMIWYKDTKNNFLRVNQLAAKAMGKPAHEIEGRSCGVFFPQDAQHYYQDDLEVIKTGKPKLGIIESLQTASGENRWVRTDKVPYRDYKGVLIGVVVFSVDITDRMRAEQTIQESYRHLKEIQQKLIQSEKIAALGRFSTNIAHEVKNPLGIMLGGLEFLEQKLPHDNEGVYDTVEKLKIAVLRANTILGSLLQYAHPAEQILEVIKASEAVNLALDMVKRKASHTNITINTKFDKDTTISVDKNQMQQAILNILFNAIDALPGGGRISIDIYKAVVAEFSSQQSCVIEINDSGEGIAHAEMEKIFEPFFTTKERKIGTGLGLYVTKTIIENLKGQMFIDSIKGVGTRIRIVLPLASY